MGKYKNKVFFINDRTCLFGKLIYLYNMLKFGRSEASHVGVCAKEEKDRVLIFEAVPSGFVSSWYDKSWLEGAIERGTVKFKETKRLLHDVEENCKKYEGTKYGYINLAIHAINLFLLTIFKFSIKYSDGLVAGHCSELVSRVLYDSSDKHIDFSKEYEKEFDLVSPQEIFMSSFMK